MIKILDTKKCSACGACINICPVSAIKFIEDEEGFRYPNIDNESCIKCNKCERVCPMLNETIALPVHNISFKSAFYAGQLRDRELLNEVSSGGAFWAFAQIVLDQNGIIYGAVQNNVDEVYHIRADTVNEAARMRRSKYLQSDVGDCYARAKEDLANGRVVLFSGTGCQIAGLNTFLGKTYDNLYTCDVVCHGVPSMKAWRSYRTVYERFHRKKIVELVFRDKSKGWSENQYKITHDDGSILRIRSTRQLFHYGYLQGLFYRPSCGTCSFACLPRVSDVTLADYWKYSGSLNSKDNDIGISLITVNNEKGLKLLECSRKYLLIETTSKEMALESCKHLNEHPSENLKREDFFRTLYKYGYHFAIHKFMIIEKKKSLYRKIINVISRMKRRKKDD